MKNTILPQVQTPAKRRHPRCLKTENILPAGVSMLNKQNMITDSIPFEIMKRRPIYSAEEAVNEVGATMAFEGMPLTEEDLRMLYNYSNGDVSGDDLRQKILEGTE